MRADSAIGKIRVENSNDLENIRKKTPIREAYIGKYIQKEEICAYFDDSCWGTMEWVDVDEDNDEIRGIDGILYSKDGKEMLRCPGQRAGTLIIPEGVERIGDGACRNANIESVSFPKSLEEIGHKAFQGCPIKEVRLNNGLLIIDMNAFFGCPVKYVKLPRTLMHVGKDAFGKECLEYVEAENFRSAATMLGSVVKMWGIEVPEEWQESMSGKAITFGICGREYAIPTELRLDGKIAVFWQHFGIGPYGRHLLKKAYKLAAAPAISEDAALDEIQAHPKNKQAKELVRKNAEKMAKRYSKARDDAKIEKLARSGLAPAESLQEMLGAAENGCTKAYVLQAMHEAGMGDAGFDEGAFEL